MPYECARRSVAPIRNREPTENTLNRCESLLQDNDDMRVWKVIDWSGNVSTHGNTDHDCPSDEAFKTHFEMIFNLQVLRNQRLTTLALISPFRS